MLAIFHKAFAHPPEELNSPASLKSSKKPKLPEQTRQEFISSHPTNTFSMRFGDATVLAYVRPDHHSLFHQNQKLDNWTAVGGRKRLLEQKKRQKSLQIYQKIKQYGLARNTNEDMLVIEAYRTLRNRGPYPADQVIKDLDGSFAFVVYDSKVGTIFTALGSDGGVKLYWGIAADGSVVISDDLEVIKTSCAKSFALFPASCIFHSEGGLMSFEHPMNKLRVDSVGVMCGANFKVDHYARVDSIPRIGNEANWAEWNSHEP